MRIFVNFSFMALLILSACGGGSSMNVPGSNAPSPPVKTGSNIPTEFQPFLDNFKAQANALGDYPTMPTNLYLADPSVTSQLSSKQIDNNFYISKTAWDSLHDNCSKEVFLFRELGLWVLNRSYVNQQSSGVNSSVMNPSGFSCDIYVTNYSYFMKELFVDTFLAFNSNPDVAEKQQGWISFNSLYP